MERTAVNPSSWSVQLGFDQAQLVEGQHRMLICSGQDAVDADGNSQHPGDVAAQLALAADNLETVLAAAGMSFADVIRLNIYTTDIDTLLQHCPVLTGRFEGTSERFASTLLGVARLAGPELLVALEATAMDWPGTLSHRHEDAAADQGRFGMLPAAVRRVMARAR